MKPQLAIVGVSAGGLDALSVLLSALPADFDIPLVLVQHRSKDSRLLCDVLQDCSALPLHEVTDKEPIEPGHVYLAPADYHLLVEEGYFSLSVDAPELYSRPSIDAAFESAADAYGAGALGIVMTGANHDGSRGLRAIVDRGGRAVVQDPHLSEVDRMPRAALQAVPEALVLPLEGIATHLVALQRNGAGRQER